MLEIIPAVRVCKQLFGQPDHPGEGVEDQLCPPREQFIQAERRGTPQ
ncbi:hypothetical protein ACFTAO_05250 [Paenibacillus rhizoplanae]